MKTDILEKLNINNSGVNVSNESELIVTKESFEKALFSISTHAMKEASILVDGDEDETRLTISEIVEIPNYINLEDFKEVSQTKLSVFLDKEIGKNGWNRSIDNDNVHTYRRNSRDDKGIVGFVIFEDNKSEKWYIKNVAEKASA